ncbi:hypothetical protein COT86_02080 [Candidatus Collierbacteria bacterium CG10_big_fil_rev_8_21_14_0_10_43_36]|uniref:Glycosyltransferase 2-like domain-containing protein n=3 Tax=Candidatus Collieribacteriota TaxID=1752725 RepID=A0A2H0DX29_9BACT|nr:glycosyltransferase family 2 protein [bacterium]PIP86140.1 MAG: hypothetical protein COW83_00520 [Candidatus Collierbacteria bacterium CG22_combo_CG10-13_8_21_14_all_43_12]PIR99790.1 MAG: hypothetical protein COT86_02080 [Candidatus Collierbacteria bacterium CG10_big_fil_rev_8_21_14_0_10_43_36]PIZ24173.1 MAG: hypothetical protein COY48_04475 [Candidatus Collierbacteria bacterium CG_4_10_14_0_8_um_filter_43_86]PJB47689.1 MAG: hypothetical protein CO104_03070 [Candidatus Collierbacteria bacter
MDREEIKMETLTISLILLAYNDEKTVKIALESILNQDILERNIQVDLTVLPNGCTDGTVQTINNFFKTKTIPDSLSWRCIVSPIGNRNKALNMGLKETTGKYVFYMNADCTISEGAISASVNLFDNKEVVRLVGLHVIPNTDHLLADSFIKGMFEIEIASGKIKGKEVPIGRFMGMRNGLIESVPEDIHSEDIWLDLFTADKYGLDSITVIKDEYVYWNPPADWAEYINLYARYKHGMTQLFKAHPESFVIFQKFMAEVKPKSTVELREEIVDVLVGNGKEKDKAEELFELYKNVNKIYHEQEKILNSKLINSSGKWLTDR